MLNSFKSAYLGAIILACLSLATFFFIPTADDANAQEYWTNTNFQSCIYDNLDKIHADRAATLLEEYCIALHGDNNRRR